ncbi:AAA family ATPase [Mycobacterium spongiae]|uniref:AAA family ATPase n=1 Tax=Mycobacterium spongiae TaxID=886343 RepID=A0A975JZC4_9MYCO|nr:bifunctional aminoglycoside phosphotransferase/ATP-binding protein [Mycobacterium spongiae]QUR67849.1 AAA family ATPase [Mycobacterium spongiae]
MPAPDLAPGAPYADVRETHTAVVVLVGDRVFKAKKPVVTDFCDFRTTEQRERACIREVELNRRLAAQSYLGIAHLSDPGGANPEPIVVMRRYDDTQRLASMVTRGVPVEDALDAVAAVLSRFHQRAGRNRLISAQGEVDAVAKRWHDNLTELDRYAGSAFPGEVVDRIGELVNEFIRGRDVLFTRRVDEGCIVDGHADLLADDIFLLDGEPALLDCLEFDDELRYVDRIDDAAFLAMDLEFLGRKDLGGYFLDRYAAHSGDTAPASLRDFYLAYRAVVRAKVECVRMAQGKTEAGADAGRHLTIATEHLCNGAVRLALVGGSPGTGKSTVARALAQRVGARVISTDDVRRELTESGVIQGQPGVLDSGLYSRDNVRAVYDAALRQAHRLLGAGQSVILDATWGDPRDRAQAHRLAKETHSPIVELRCSATADMTADRISTRAAGNSDATPEIATALAARQGGWDTAYLVDTSAPLDESAGRAYDIWHRTL